MARSAAARKGAEPAPIVRNHEYGRMGIGAFEIAPENPRTIRRQEDIDALAQNVAAHGVLEPLVGYLAGGKLLVTVGGTRLLAARKAGLKELPYAQLAKEAAIAAGLAEQEGHTPLHPADQAVAFKAELVRRVGAMRAGAETQWQADREAAIKTIANGVGRSARFVEQRLALADLHPPILQALRENKITVHQAEAWANADPERQATLWKQEGKRGAIHDARSIKKLIDKADLADTDRLVRFVGEAAYKAAGGGVRQDLFEVPLETWDRNAKAKGHYTRSVIMKLAREKMAAAKVRAEKEGWGHVETVLGAGRAWPHKAKACKTAADRAKHAIEISIGNSGKLEYVRGLPLPAKPGKADKKTAAEQEKAQARDHKAEEAARNAHKRTLATASEILGRTLHAAPRIALRVLAAQLAREEFAQELRARKKGGRGESVVGMGSSAWRSDKTLALASDKTWATVRAGWADKLRPHVDNLEQALVTDFSDQEVGALLAFCVSCAIEIDEWDPERPSSGRAHMLRLAKLAPPNMLEHLPQEDGPPLLYQLLGATPPATGKIADAIKAQAKKSRGAK